MPVCWRNGHALTRAIPGPGKREWIEHLLLAILALLAAGLALPEVDPELDDREVPFFDQNARQMLSGATRSEARLLRGAANKIIRWSRHV